MADEFKKKILIDVEAKTDTLKQNAAVLNVTLDEVKAKMKDVELQSGKNSAAYQEQASKLRLTQSAIRDNNRELDNATKALNANGNSIAQNRALVATLTAEHIKLSQAEGEGSKAAMDMQSRLKSVLDTLKDQTKAYGDNRLEVGNYKIAADGLKGTHDAANAGFKSLTGNIMGTVGGFGFLPQGVKEASSTFMGFVNTQKQVVQGFQQHNSLIEQSVTANKSLIVANEELAVATAADMAAKEALASTAAAEAIATAAAAEAQEALAAGTGTEAAAAAAAAVAIEAETAAIEAQKVALGTATTAQSAQTTATAAQTVATEASTVATDAGAASMKLLKIAIASTGVGLLVIALGVLVTYFESTNEGSKKFKVILSEIGAVVQTSLKTLGAFGKVIYDIISGNFKALSGDFNNASNGLKNIVGDSVTAAKAAGAITVERQKLTKEERLWSEEKLKQQGILDVLKLKIRDQSLAESERVKIAKQAKALSTEIFQNELTHAEANAKLVAKEQALNSKKDYQAITDANNRVQQLKNSHDQELQSIQNKEAKVEKTMSRSADKQLKNQESLNQKMAKALSEADNIKAQSLTKQLQDTFDAYGSEILAQDQHYNDELTKVKKLSDEKLITLSKFNEVKAQLEAEHLENIKKITDKFNKEDAASVLKAQNDLATLQNQAIENATEKQIATLKQQGIEKSQQLDVEGEALKAQLDKQQKEIQYLRDNGRDADADLIQKSYDATLAKQTIQGQKRVKTEKQTEDAILKVKTDAANKQIATNDEIAVLLAGDNASKKHKALLDQAGDEFTIAINQEGKTQEEKYLIYQQYLAKTKQLDQDYNSSKMAQAKQMEKMIQDFAFSTLTNSLQRTSDLKIGSLERQKAAELKNTSLTSTQKTIIEEKYRAKEAAEKVKEFKTNQKLSIAQALINGFLAMIKTTANVGFPLSFAFSPIVAAETALTVAGIAAQKPPAYATGGLHYQSDGRGALLRGPGTGTSDSMNARLSNGEAIINAKSTSVFSGLLSQINQWGGGASFGKSFGSTSAFASGGVFSSTYLPTSDNGLRPSSINIHSPGAEINYERLIGGFADAVSQLPAPITDIKDINYQQGIISNTMNRVNL